MNLCNDYFLIELDDSKEDPEVDEHANEYVSLHLLNADDVIHQFKKRGKLKPHKDLLDASLTCIV